MLAYLLEKAARAHSATRWCDAHNHVGRTALHLACLRRNPYEATVPEYIKLLLKNRNIDRNVPDAEGKTVLMVALERRDAVLEDFLYQAGARVIEPSSQNHNTISIR